MDYISIFYYKMLETSSKGGKEVVVLPRLQHCINFDKISK